MELLLVSWCVCVCVCVCVNMWNVIACDVDDIDVNDDIEMR